MHQFLVVRQVSLFLLRLAFPDLGCSSPQWLTELVLVMCRSGRACISGLGRIFGNIDRDSICSDPQDPSWKFLSRRYIELLQIMPQEDIRSARKNPVEFIYPYAKLLVSEVNFRIQDIAYHLESQFFLGASGRAETTTLEATWAALHDMEQDMRPSLQSFANFPCPESPKRTSAIRDFDDLIQQCEVVQRTLRDYLSRHVGMKSLEESRLAVLESRKSIEQAESVKRLTQLAFVFLPLNLATSLFGMNMTEFGTGSLHIWVFVAVASSLSLLVGLAVFVFARKYRQKTS
jgi:CorA-like Mg2+ transporter protein